MFPKHDDFAVRTVGLPGMIGALGACFGRVVTLDSPKARPPGDFNWAPTLWHELAHVMTLQLSKQRVPRWLTEGISTYEEKLGSPAWGREGELSFVAAYGAGEHMTLRELNAAFQDPEKISLAYYEASILTEHIVGKYGMDALRKLLVTLRRRARRRGRAEGGARRRHRYAAGRFRQAAGGEIRHDRRAR